MPSMREFSGPRSHPVKHPASRQAAIGCPAHRNRLALPLAAALLCAGMAAGLPARAQQDLTTGTPEQAAALRSHSQHALVGPALMARLLQLTGHKLQRAGFDEGRPNLVVDAGGIRYGIDFYQCVAGKMAADGKAAAADPAKPGAMAPPVCASMRFTTAFDMPDGLAPALANAWNRDRRFGRLWLDESGDPNLEMDVSTAGGVTTAHLVDVLDWWTLVLSDFLQKLQVLDAEAKATAGAAPK